MTAPDGNYTSMVGRGDVQALMPEQVNGSMAKRMDARRHAATRGVASADGRVTTGGGLHLGHVERTGRAWRARTRTGKVLGLHPTKQQAVGALVLRHEGLS